MCARLLSCPLCSQPGFVTLDALRAGLVSVATRPLACPVCDETLLGIDKLTIHLFGHTINATSRGDAQKSQVINHDSRNHEETAASEQNWNVPNNPPLLCERTPTDDMADEKLAFVPLSNLNSSNSVAAIVLNKNANSTPTTVGSSQSYATVSEDMENHVNRIIFVPNLRQQQFHSPTRRNCSGTLTNGEIYESPGPLLFQNPMQNDAPALTLPSQTCSKKSSRKINTDEIYQSDHFIKNSNVGMSEEKIDVQEHYSETWIENLLQDNSEKSPEDRDKSPSEEKKKYSMKNSLDLSKDEKFSYSQVNINQGQSSNMKESQFHSQNSDNQRSEAVFKGNHPINLTSANVLPQLKALRLLAMKDKTERCNICGIPVPDRNILSLHKQVVHMIAEKDINTMPEELLKNYPCHLCTKIFKNRGSLMVHMRIAHIGYNFSFDGVSLAKDKDIDGSCCENGYNCPTCGKNFRKEQHVTQHLKTHEGKQWECDICSKMFTTKYFLKKHKRLHSGEMPYKCTLCDKTFTFQQSYHKHRLYHKDDKPHTCATCGRSFKELSTLHNHERIHTGEKPFVCETCGKCFRQRVSYLVHRRIHTGVMPYKCDACGKSFRYKVSQRTHKCPIQPEDSGASVAEAGTTNASLASSSCGDSSAVTKSSIFVQNDGMTEISTSDNKFILIVNTQGQPMLARESDVRTNFLNESQSESQENNKVNEDGDNELWKNLSCKNASKDSTNSHPMEKCTGPEEKLSTNDANDFFSIVMSPLENDLSSPSSEMEHLRLSSPRNDETRQNDSVEICENDPSNILQNDLSNAIEGIFRNNCSNNSPLETINEESLKQLLYGIDRKS
ncbi:uncharacterized protein [Venturia canescens]|uniref:uncharacterized protein n=1 Tax=Venturia canescens TaxID=32260 RepID=UPI001C9D4724|nr:uncharacterized protein LOC122410932 [Venturia canescens]